MSTPDQPVVLDTNVLSELARPAPAPAVVAYLQRVSRWSLTTSVVIGELTLGVELLPAGARRTDLEHHLATVIESYRQRTIPLTVAVAQNYARSVAVMRASGRAISVNDAYIAAAAVTAGAQLCTRNIQDFEHYPGLEVITPFDAGPAAH